jgi:hypothetical protein
MSSTLFAGPAWPSLDELYPSTRSAVCMYVPSCTSVHSPSASASAPASASASASASARPRSHHLSALHERERKKKPPSQHLIPSTHPVTTSYLVPSHTTPCHTRPSPLHFSACARVPPTRGSPQCNVPLISLAAPPPYAAAPRPKQSGILHAGLLCCSALRCAALLCQYASPSPSPSLSQSQSLSLSPSPQE